jgi:hypothetical protein
MNRVTRIGDTSIRGDNDGQCRVKGMIARDPSVPVRAIRSPGSHDLEHASRVTGDSVCVKETVVVVLLNYLTERLHRVELSRMGALVLDRGSRWRSTAATRAGGSSICYISVNILAGGTVDIASPEGRGGRSKQGDSPIDDVFHGLLHLLYCFRLQPLYFYFR